MRFYDRKDDGYTELPKYITIESLSHPFIADLNGDFLDDVMYTDASGGIKIAYQAVSGGEEIFVVKDFASAIPLSK